MKSVSILIPAYKPSHFRMCLTSAIAQSWENREIIVSDDCPTDAIQNIVSEFSAHVTYLRNPSPGCWGINNLQHLMSVAQGDYIKFLFDDDILHPFCTQYLVEALEAASDRNATLAFSPRRTIDNENHPIELINPFGIASTTVIDGRDILRQMARTLLNQIGEFTTVLFRKQDLVEPDGSVAFMTIDGTLCPGLADVAVFAHLCAKGNAVVTPDTLSYFRVHPASNSNPDKNGNWPNLITDWRLVIDLAARKGVIDAAELYAAYAHLVGHIKAWRHAYPEFGAAFDRALTDIAVAAPTLAISPREQSALAAAARGSEAQRKGFLSRLRDIVP
jgi:glycosyltransferase involved in cell wall biosynthesis